MKNIVLLLCASLAFNFFTGAEEFERLHQSIDPQIIGAGRVQLFDYKTKEDKVYRVGAVLIDAPREIIRDILADPEQLGDAMPYLEYQKIRNLSAVSVHRDEGEMIVEGRFAIPHFPAQYTIIMNFDCSGMWRKWRILTPDEVDSYNRSGIDVLRTSGLIKDMSGFDHLESFDDGTKTVYYYSLDIDSAIPLPEFIRRSIYEAVFTRHMALIKEMAESLVKEPAQDGADINREDQN